MKKPLPGIPTRHLLDPRIEQEITPRSIPPAGEFRIEGRGWRAKVPNVVVMAAISAASAIGARLLPTQTSTDVAIERAQVAAERRELADEKFREEVRGSIRGFNDRLDRLETRISLLESAALKRPSQ